MKLKDLLTKIKPIEIIGNADVDVTGINIDSRKIESGHLFIAMRGTQVDGHQFIPKAIELGATAVLCEDVAEPVEGVTYVKVADCEDCVGPVATTFYGDPT
jgi:UDP-N-acetylmuramoyl-L-alanyl-D-glutamate--2,6-diaminopimelate ligase